MADSSTSLNAQTVIQPPVPPIPPSPAVQQHSGLDNTGHVVEIAHTANRHAAADIIEASGVPGPSSSHEAPQSHATTDDHSVEITDADADEDEDEDEDEDDESGDDEIDIRDTLSDALAGDVEFKGTFSYKRAYPDAPNPSLNLSDLGTVGLPLSAREAEVVKSRCRLAPFGKGERTLVDKTVRDTWELDALNVRFENPQWNTFLARIVQDVCQVLGVNFQASRPKCELYKLLLYETGSHFLPHVDTEKVDGMFATIVIVLPSRFSGGDAHLSHGGLSTVYDCSTNSQLETTVLSWYTDVTHEIKPITSGYRLALSYNLIHTTQSLRPSLSANADLVQSLRRIFKSWEKDEGQDTPEKIVYLLDHQYSQANLRASALKGADAHKVAMLDTLAQELGFRMGLATVACHLSGPAEGDYGGGGGGWGRSRWGYRSPSVDPADLEFGEIEDRTMSIEHFVDMQGDLIAKKIEFDEETEVIPLDLAEEVESGPCDNEQYEGYQGNWAGNLERWYRRTVLIIWPSWQNYAFLYSGPNGLRRARQELLASNSTIPTEAELGLGRFIMSKSGPAGVAEALCHVALNWRDPVYWSRAIIDSDGPKGVNVLPENKIFDAIELFGLEKIKTALELLLRSDQGNTSRFQFLAHLDVWASARSNVESTAAIRAWVTAQHVEAIKTLKKPQISEQTLLLSVAHAQGGLSFLKDQMLHQIVSLADDDFLHHFASTVHANPRFPQSEEKSLVVSGLLSAAISKASFITVPTPVVADLHTVHRNYGAAVGALPPPVDNFAIVTTYMQKCYDLGCGYLVGTLLDRITDTSKLSMQHAQEYAQKVMIPLVALLAQRAKTEPENVDFERFKKLRLAAIKLYMDWLDARFQAALSRPHFTTLFKAVVIGINDGDVFCESVMPRLQTARFSSASLQALFEELSVQESLGPAVSSVTAPLLQKYIAQVNLDIVPNIIGALEWCCKVRHPELCAEILRRVCDPPKLTAAYLTTTLAPLLPQLRAWGTRNNCDVNSVVQIIVVAWVEKVLGPPPPANPTLATQISGLSNWHCPNSECVAARTFLTKGETNVTILSRIGAPRRKHVERELTMYARALATWTMIGGSPQGLRITKSEALCRLAKWKNLQAKGVELLRQLGKTDELRRILGAQYDRVENTLKGITPPARAPSLPMLSLPSNPTPSAAQTPAAVAGPSTQNVHPHPHPPAQAPSTTSAAAEPPAKKRKVSYNPNDVIDLT